MFSHCTPSIKKTYLEMEMTMNSVKNLIPNRWQRALLGGLFLMSILMSLALQLDRLSISRVAAFAQDGTVSPDKLWQAVDEALLGGQARPDIAPQSYRVFRLNQDALNQLLARVPKETEKTESVDTKQNPPVEMIMPLPDGRFARFAIEESSIMETDLAAEHPEIKTYRGQGLDDPAATVRFDLTPAGFHALLLSERGSVHISPEERERATYISYFGDAYLREAEEFHCEVVDDHLRENGQLASEAPAQISLGPVRRTYRIAIAATQEYVNAPALGGGSVQRALASIVTWLNQLNLIYERELSVRFVLVANNVSVIFPSEPDPFTNGNTRVMLDEARNLLRDRLGAANYDIGHVLGTGFGGIAYLRAACSNNLLGDFGPVKGGGVTLVNADGPVGNPRDLGVLGHEVGHQVGATHTFNASQSSNCGNSRAPNTAWEPGSGSTLMSYAGICTGNNVTNNWDFRFHLGSYKQISAFITNRGSGGSCPTETETGNHAPTLVGLSVYTIPRNTPFMAGRAGNDADPADAGRLTYTVDQLDAGGDRFPSPPYTDTNDGPNSTRPLFRAQPASTNPIRLFPSLTYILNSANMPPPVVNGLQTAENLPAVRRTMNFGVTVRDGRGGVSFIEQQVAVTDAAGPFTVAQPNTRLTWQGGTLQTVRWNVAGTEPLAKSVVISLSLNGGQTFPYTLSYSTPNDGNERVRIPNVPTTRARIRVTAFGTIFLDISDSDFTITPGVAPLYRLFNQRADDHLFTLSSAERDRAVAQFGYRSEGIACYVFSSQAAGTVPLYRLFNPRTDDHFFTVSAAERDSAVAMHGYRYEMVACYVFGSQAAGTVPLYRLFNPRSGGHLYTVSVAERDRAVAQYGHRYEGIACYVFE
jgi:hypothetical protein